MSEYHFTDETATVVVLHSLVNDMHHALGRIALACELVAASLTLLAFIDAFRGMWVGVACDVAGAVAFFVAGYETWKRRRKYRPATTTPDPNDEPGARAEGESL